MVGPRDHTLDGSLLVFDLAQELPLDFAALAGAFARGPPGTHDFLIINNNKLVLVVSKTILSFWDLVLFCLLAKMLHHHPPGPLVRPCNSQPGTTMLHEMQDEG